MNNKVKNNKEIIIPLKTIGIRLQDIEQRNIQLKADLFTILAQYEKQLIEIEELLDYAVTNDILSDGGNQKQVQNITAKKQNIAQMMETEKIKLAKIKELSTDNLRKAVPEVYKQVKEDISYFQKTVDDELFRQLSEVRKEQERILCC